MPSKDRERMVATQIEARGITDPLVLDAMRTVPRERFVPASMARFAYDDGSLPIGKGQTISQPYIVAIMTEAVRIKPGERVLEIGTGSGYGAAVLARIAGEVYTVERMEELAETARHRLAELGYDNVHVLESDGSLHHVSREAVRGGGAPRGHSVEPGPGVRHRGRGGTPRRWTRASDRPSQSREAAMSEPIREHASLFTRRSRCR
jgi:predicted O-methyltransferase YrrM